VLALFDQRQSDLFVDVLSSESETGSEDSQLLVSSLSLQSIFHSNHYYLP